jgi:hypothetical protein
VWRLLVDLGSPIDDKASIAFQGVVMAIKSTRLRLFKSKDAEKVLQAVNELSFKVEIKSIDLADGVWCLWFILPESELPAFEKLDLVVNLD